MNIGFRRWRIGFGFTLLCALAYVPALLAVLRGGYPFDSDALAAFGPWREFTRQNLQNGTLPLWNPHVFCGMPFLANGQSAVLYPPSVIYLFLPLPWAQLLDAYGHHLLLACGGYVFARALGLSRSASFLSGALLALGGAVSARIYEGHLTWHDTRAYIPWLLYSTLLLLRGGKWLYVAACATLCALMLAAGHLAMVILGCAMAFSLVVAYVLSHRRQWRAIPWKRLVMALILAASLGAVSLLPLQEAGSYSVRAAPVTYSFATWNSASWRTFARLLVPDFFGGNHNLQWSISLYAHEEAASIGIVALVLALGAPFLARRRGQLPAAVPWLCVAMLLAALLALGNKTPLYRWGFDHLPLFRSMRIPARWMELWFLCSALLVGFSWDGLCLYERKAVLRKTALCWALGMLCIAAFGFTLWLFSTDSSQWLDVAQRKAKLVDLTPIQAAERLRGVAIQSTLIATIVTGLAAFALWRWEKEHVRRRWQAAMVGLLILNCLWIFWRDARPLDAAKFEKYAQWLPEITKFYRPGDRWATAFAGQWSVYAWNGHLTHGIDLFNGYDPVGPRAFFRFASALEGRGFIGYQYQPQRRTALLRVAGVTHTLSVRDNFRPPATTFGAPAHETTAGYWTLWRHDGAWPRVYLTTNMVRVPVDRQLEQLEKLAANGFTSAGQPVVLAPGALPAVKPAKTAGRVLHWQRNANRFDVELSTNAPAALVVGDNHYAGWRAYVTPQVENIAQGGETTQAPVVAANYLFRAVEVPPRTRRVTLVYEPQTFRFALFVSLAGLAALFSLLSFHFWKGKS